MRYFLIESVDSVSVRAALPVELVARSKLRVFGLPIGVGSVRAPKIGVVGSFGMEIVGGEET